MKKKISEREPFNEGRKIAMRNNVCSHDECLYCTFCIFALAGSVYIYI